MAGGNTPEPPLRKGRPFPHPPRARTPTARGRCATDRPPSGVSLKNIYHFITALQPGIDVQHICSARILFVHKCVELEAGDLQFGRSREIYEIIK